MCQTRRLSGRVSRLIVYTDGWVGFLRKCTLSIEGCIGAPCGIWGHIDAYIVFSRFHKCRQLSLVRILKRQNQLPFPDYSDYFILAMKI